MASIGPFLNALLQKYPVWQHLPITERAGDGWQGFALTVPPPSGSDLAGPLDIEEVAGEISISLDYSHIHMQWPPKSAGLVGTLWTDAMDMIDAILNEKILSLSGWIDGKLRVGSLREVGGGTQLLVPNLHRLRFRSWRGTFDRDDVLFKDA